MKKTTLSMFCFFMQILCYLVIPTVFIWVQSGGLAHGYKLSATAIISVIIVFLVFKKIMLNSWLKKIDSKINQIEVNQLTATDETAINSLKKKWKALSFTQLFINIVIPIACLILFLITIKVVEAGLIKLYGCLLVSTISIIFGVIFKIIEIYTAKTENEL